MVYEELARCVLKKTRCADHGGGTHPLSPPKCLPHTRTFPALDFTGLRSAVRREPLVEVGELDDAIREGAEEVQHVMRLRRRRHHFHVHHLF